MKVNELLVPDISCSFLPVPFPSNQRSDFWCRGQCLIELSTYFREFELTATHVSTEIQRAAILLIPVSRRTLILTM